MGSGFHASLPSKERTSGDRMARLSPSSARLCCKPNVCSAPVGAGLSRPTSHALARTRDMFEPQGLENTRRRTHPEVGPEAPRWGRGHPMWSERCGGESVTLRTIGAEALSTRSEFVGRVTATPCIREGTSPGTSSRPHMGNDRPGLVGLAFARGSSPGE